MAILYVLLVAALNAFAGFALAVYAGRRYDELQFLAQHGEPPPDLLMGFRAPPPDETDVPMASDDVGDEDEIDEEETESSGPEAKTDRDVDDAVSEIEQYDSDDEADDFGWSNDDEDEGEIEDQAEDVLADEDVDEETGEESPSKETVESVESDLDGGLPSEEELQELVGMMGRRPDEDESESDETEWDDEEEDSNQSEDGGAEESRDESPVVGQEVADTRVTESNESAGEQPSEAKAEEAADDVEEDDEEWKSHSPEVSSEGDRALTSTDLGDATPPPLQPARIILEHFGKKALDFHSALSATTDRMRAMLRSERFDEMEGLVGELPETIEEHRKECTQLVETLRELERENRALSPAVDRIATAGDLQVARIRQVDDQIKGFGKGKSAKKATSQLSSILMKTIAAHHGLLDAVDLALGMIVPDMAYFASLPEKRRKDRVTKLLNREGIKAFFHEYLLEKDGAEKSLGMALADIDEMTEINGKYGQNVGDRVILAVARLLNEHKHQRCVIGRITGQQFAFLFNRTDSQVTASEMERMRQLVEKARFLWNGEEIQVSISALVLEDDHPTRPIGELYDQAIGFMSQGKRQRRNRTYHIQNGRNAPIVPPKYKIEEFEIQL